MKTQSAQLKAHFEQETMTLTECWKVVLKKHQPRIVEITKANPGVITTRWSHGFSTGQQIRVVGVEGMTEVNGLEYTVTVIDPVSFSIGTDTSAFTAYVNKGYARKILAFTSHADDITFEGITYKNASGYNSSSLNAKGDLSVDDVHLTGLLDSDEIKATDIEAGLWADAEIEVFQVNYKDLSMGRMILPPTGNLGEITTKRPGLYIAELRGLQHYLQQQLGEHYSLLCRADLGDTRCKVKLEPPKWRPSLAYTATKAKDAGIGDRVRPTVYNERHFKCVTAGTSGAIEPTWDLTVGNQTTDGSVIWETVDALTKLGSVTSVVSRRKFQDTGRSEIPAALLGFKIVAVVGFQSPGGRFEIKGDQTAFFSVGLKFRVSGSTGNDTIYSVKSVSYNAGNARTEITVNEIIQDATVDGQIDIARTGWFDFGLLTFLSGKNMGISREVRRFSMTAYPITQRQGFNLFEIDGDKTIWFLTGDTFFVSGSTGNDGKYTVVSVSYNAVNDRTEITISGTFPDGTIDGSILHKPPVIELFEQFPFDIAVGDSYEIHVGCDKFLTTCIDKHDNLFDFRGEPNLPGLDQVLIYPDAK